MKGSACAANQVQQHRYTGGTAPVPPADMRCCGGSCAEKQSECGMRSASRSKRSMRQSLSRQYMRCYAAGTGWGRIYPQRRMHLVCAAGRQDRRQPYVWFGRCFCRIMMFHHRRSPGYRVRRLRRKQKRVQSRRSGLISGCVTIAKYNMADGYGNPYASPP